MKLVAASLLCVAVIGVSVFAFPSYNLSTNVVGSLAASLIPILASSVRSTSAFNGSATAEPQTIAQVNDDLAPAAAFTPGNLVVYRVGDGSAALNTNATAVFLNEYTPAGVLVQSIAIPTTTVGANRRMTSSGSATSEGLITRSTDGQYLTAAGYDAAVGTGSVTTSTSATINRVIARIGANGTVDTSTALTDAISGGNPRGVASTNGTDLWISGTSSGGGIRYTTFGATTSTSLTTDPTNFRAPSIFNGQLYVSAQSGAFRLATVGSGTPTAAGQTTTNLPGYPTATTSPYQFFFADLDVGVAGLDTVYVSDDNSVGGGGGVRKYSLVAGSWTLNGTLSLAAIRGLTAAVTGTSVTLYVTGGTPTTALQTITDSSGYNAAPTGTFTLLVNAPTNTAFRGIAFAPIAPDTTAPAAPLLTSSNPTPPSSDLTPDIQGTAEANSTVKLYTTADCSGAILGQGTATGGNFAINVTVVNNATTNIYATATDAATNVSPCSTPAFAYTHAAAPPVISVTDVNFGNVLAGTFASGNITVSNTAASGEPLTINSVTLSDNTSGWFSVFSSPAPGTQVPPNATVVVRCSPPADATGSQNATVTIGSNSGPGGDNVSSLSCTAPAPEIEIAPSAIDFGTQTEAAPSGLQSVTILNTGTADLVLGTLAKTGTNAADFAIVDNPSGATIAAGASRQVRVRFTPSALGSRTAQINIPNNDADENPASISLSGYGVAASAQVAAKALWVFGESVVPHPIVTATGRNTLISRSDINGVNKLYVSVWKGTPDPTSLRHMHPDADIGALIAAAHDAGHEVWAAYGDEAWPDLTSGCTTSTPQTYMAEVAAYNASRGNANERFDGVMLDVEPSPDPTTPAEFQTQIAHYECMRNSLPASIKLGAALRFYWDELADNVTYPAVGGTVKPAIHHIIDLDLDSIVIMGYRDIAGTACPANGIICLDENEIAYATSIGRAGLVLAGLETISGQPDNVTFFEEGQSALDAESALVAGHFASSSGFGGFAIHNYMAAYLSDTTGWPATPPTPVMTTSPGPLNFGSRDIGAGASTVQSFTIANNGTANLNYSFATTGDADQFNVSGGTPGVITPGNSAQVDVQFDPTSVGAKSATVTVSGDDPANPSDTITLNGTGTVPASGTRYVTTGGTDLGGNTCLAPVPGCATIEYAITQAGAGDTISIGSGTFTEFGISVNKNLTITGVSSSNTIVQASVATITSPDRVFKIESGVTVSMSDLTVQHGKAPDGATGPECTSFPCANGGDGGAGGGILNEGTLTLTDMVVNENRSGKGGTAGNISCAGACTNTGGKGGLGGAVASTGSLIVITSSFANNEVGDGGDAAVTVGCGSCSSEVGETGNGGALGGAIVSVTGSEFVANTAFDGGAIQQGLSAITITNSFFTENFAANSGGAINCNGVVHTCSISGSTISGNSVGGILYGGAVAFFGTSTKEIYNSTVSGNTSNANAGGIFANSGIVNITFVTIAGNTADENDNGSGNGGGLYREVATVNLKNSIIADNVDKGGEAHQIAGTIGSSGYNHVESILGSTFTPGTGDVIEGDPGLAPLNDNGGPTQTQGLYAGSPAIDQIPSGENDCGSVLLSFDVDQRGFPRPALPDTPCDKGAFEGNVGTAAREIDVTGLAVSIADGDTTPSAVDDTDFGSTSTFVTNTFTIHNFGTAILTISNPIITGANFGDFEVTDLPTLAIGPGGSTTFDVTFDPLLPGLRTATITIVNDDVNENPYSFAIQGTGAAAAPEIQFSSATYSASEGAGNVLMTVNRTGSSVGAVSATIIFAGGTATGDSTCGLGVDYDNTSQVVNFADGDATAKNVFVPICNEADVELDETYTATLGTPTGGAVIGTIGSATNTIINDDTPPDNKPPVIVYTPLTNVLSPADRTFDVTVTDDVGVDSVRVTWENNGSITSTLGVCVFQAGNVWQCTIDADSPPQTPTGSVTYVVSATDTSNNAAANPAGGIRNLYTIGNNGTIDTGVHGVLDTVMIGSGFTFPGDVRVITAITIDGNLNMGSNTLTIGCDGGIFGTSANAYIIGAVEKEFCGPTVTPFTFPVGTVNDGSTFSAAKDPEGTVILEYSPFVANVTSVTPGSSLTVQANDAIMAGVYPLHAITRWWQVTETGDITADISFTYLQQDVVGFESSFNVLRRDSMTEVYPGGTVDAVMNTGSAPGVTEFSGWSAGFLIPTAAPVSISGRVKTASGRGISNVTVYVQNMNGERVGTARTGTFGYYSIDGLTAGESYLVSIRSKRFVFEVPTRVVMLNDSIEDLDFIASP